MTTNTDTAHPDLATLDQRLILRAISDPGSFLPRGDYNGEPYGESIQHWSMRAVLEALTLWLTARRVVDLPERTSAGRHGIGGRRVVWDVGGWSVTRTTYPGEPPTICIVNGAGGIGHGIAFNPDTALHVAAAVLAAAIAPPEDTEGGVSR